MNQVRGGKLMRWKALDSTLFNRAAWVEPPRYKNHTPYMYRAGSWEGEKNGHRCYRTPNFLEADLARVDIWNCKFRYLVKDRPSVFYVEERGIWVSLKKSGLLSGRFCSVDSCRNWVYEALNRTRFVLSQSETSERSELKCPIASRLQSLISWWVGRL